MEKKAPNSKYTSTILFLFINNIEKMGYNIKFCYKNVQIKNESNYFSLSCSLKIYEKKKRKETEQKRKKKKRLIFM